MMCIGCELVNLFIICSFYSLLFADIASNAIIIKSIHLRR